MVFSSLLFLYAFLPLCLLFYYLFPGLKWRNAILILFSLTFYAWGEPLWVTLLIASSVVDYINARFIERHRATPITRLGVAFSMLFNIGVLIAFKYSGFFIANFNLLSGLSIPVPAFALPIGISFYSFQTLSYVIDVYRGDVPAQNSFPKFLLYVSLFSQLVAGPIVRYRDLRDEIEHRVVSWERFAKGVGRFAAGLGKKVLLANSAGEVAKAFLGNGGDPSVAGSWWGIIFFAFQIYFDFSGYSDMAIGLGHMFGFTFKENFNYPYISRTATEFWRRWHMSLGSFFRDYVYIPLGGNRKRIVFNLLVVWFLTGLWHGASWNFVLWGLFYGALILIERVLGAITKREAPRVLGHAYLILASLVGWTLFYYEDLCSVIKHLGKMFGLANAPLADTAFILSLQAQAFFLPICIIACLPLLPKLRERVALWGQKGIRVKEWMGAFLKPATAIGLLAIATILLVGKSYNPFLYFRF